MRFHLAGLLARKLDYGRRAGLPRIHLSAALLVVSQYEAVAERHQRNFIDGQGGNVTTFVNLDPDPSCPRPNLSPLKKVFAYHENRYHFSGIARIHLS